jgi:hypothetical protein
MTGAGRRPPIRRLATEVGIAAMIGAAIVLTIRLWGPELSHALRERLLLFRPVTALKTATAVAIVIAALRLVSVGRRGRVALASGDRAVRWCLGALARVPAVVGLTGVVMVAAGLRILLVRAETEPRVFGDEIIYTELAKNIALHGRPLLRGHLEIGYSVLYPLFLSPAYRLASDGAAAFAAAKTMNAVALALTAIPTYALARRVLSHGWSLGVAALVVLEPWMAYASLTMTESLFLPAFTVFALTVVRMLERPTPGRQLLVLITLALLVGIRPQALVLTGSVVAAILLKGLLTGSVRRVVREHTILLAALGLALLAGLIALVAGVSLPAGSARALLTAAYSPFNLAKWTLWNLAVYELALGVIALAAFPLALRGLLRHSSSDRENSLGIAALTLTTGLLLSVTALSASRFGYGILHERNLFYATPLVLACLAHWLAHGLERPKMLVVAVALGAIALPATLPDHVVQISNNVDSPTAAWLAELENQLPNVPLRGLTIGIAAAGAAALLLVRRPLVPILAVVLSFVALTGPLDYSGALTPEQDRALAWVDRALPDGATATLVHLGLSRPDQPCSRDAENAQRTLVVWTEFFNARIDGVTHMSEPVPDNVPSPKLTVAPGGIVYENGRPFTPAYAVLDSRQPIVGRRLARFDLASLGPVWQGGASLSVWKASPPLGFLTHAQPLPPRADGQEC